MGKKYKGNQSMMSIFKFEETEQEKFLTKTSTIVSLLSSRLAKEKPTSHEELCKIFSPPTKDWRAMEDAVTSTWSKLKNKK